MFPDSVHTLIADYAPAAAVRLNEAGPIGPFNPSLFLTSAKVKEFLIEFNRRNLLFLDEAHFETYLRITAPPFPLHKLLQEDTESLVEGHRWLSQRFRLSVSSFDHPRFLSAAFPHERFGFGYLRSVEFTPPHSIRERRLVAVTRTLENDIAFSDVPLEGKAAELTEKYIRELREKVTKEGTAKVVGLDEGLAARGLSDSRLMFYMRTPTSHLVAEATALLLLEAGVHTSFHMLENAKNDRQKAVVELIEEDNAKQVQETVACLVEQVVQNPH